MVSPIRDNIFYKSQSNLKTENNPNFKKLSIKKKIINKVGKLTMEDSNNSARYDVNLSQSDQVNNYPKTTKHNKSALDNPKLDGSMTLNFKDAYRQQQ